MTSILDNIRYKEHMLAQKAEQILQLQNELQSLKEQKEHQKQNKPAIQKEELTYEESIEFGKRMEQYREKLDRIERQIQRKNRELTGLEHQAQKLIPAWNIKIKVSKYADDDSSVEMFCIKFIKNKSDQTSGHFKVGRL